MVAKLHSLEDAARLAMGGMDMYEPIVPVHTTAARATRSLVGAAIVAVALLCSVALLV